MVEAISPFFKANKVWECDCMEQKESELECMDGTIYFEIKLYEIKTLRIDMKEKKQ
ncbi:MAG: glycosyl hydrolase-related protein [Lachnotalea sp.]